MDPPRKNVDQSSPISLSKNMRRTSFHMQRSVAGWMACESSYYSVAFAAKSPVRPPPPKHTPTMSVSSNAPTTRLYSPFLHSYSSALPKHFLPSPSSSHKRNRRLSTAYPIIKALDLDQNTLVAISVGAVSVAVGIGIPIFYETQIDNAAKRENTQPCFPCNGSGSQQCRFCMGSGSITVDLGTEEPEVSRCINCEGAGTLTCTTCQGSGIQPRYLDRREFKDDD